MILSKRPSGRILKVKTGYNPNSSSVGTNLAPLLFGGAFLAFFIPVVSFLVSRRLRRMRDAEDRAAVKPLQEGESGGPAE